MVSKQSKINNSDLKNINLVFPPEHEKIAGFDSFIQIKRGGKSPSRQEI